MNLFQNRVYRTLKSATNVMGKQHGHHPKKTLNASKADRRKNIPAINGGGNGSNGNGHAPKVIIPFQQNYKWIALAAALIFAGYVVMSTGQSPADPFSTLSLSVAPVILLLGYGVTIVAIMKNFKPTK